jgi:hypothetical protein
MSTEAVGPTKNQQTENFKEKKCFNYISDNLCCVKWFKCRSGSSGTLSPGFWMVYCVQSN